MSVHNTTDPLAGIRLQIDRIRTALPSVDELQRRTMSLWLERVVRTFQLGEGQDGIDELKSTDRNMLIKSLVMYLGYTATALEQGRPPLNWSISNLLANMRTYQELMNLTWKIHEKATNKSFTASSMDQWKDGFETTFWPTEHLQPNTIDLDGQGDFTIVKDKLEDLFQRLKSEDWRRRSEDQKTTLLRQYSGFNIESALLRAIERRNARASSSNALPSRTREAHSLARINSRYAAMAGVHTSGASYEGGRFFARF